jgi:hypothetical protein
MRELRNARTLQTLHERAGAPIPKFAPIVSSVRPATRAGWLVVDVSLAPGNNVQVQIPASRHTPETLAAILRSAPALYAPVGLTSNLYGPD